MVIRRIQLKNNLYLDKEQDKDDQDSKPLGEYCTFGYFDAMSIDKKVGKNLGVWQVLSEGIIGEIDGSCSVRSLLCVSGDEKKDKEFWEIDPKIEAYPLLFVSVIRLKESMDGVAVKAEMDELNKCKTKIAYFSYEHSELITFYKTKKFSDGHDFCHDLHKKFEIYKMYTIFSVKEETLVSYDRIKQEIIDEKVDCRLRAIVKDREKIHEIKEKLENALKEDTVCNPFILEYHMMGNSDVMFELNGISIQKLLACYKTNELLTHSNTDYQKAFYNVETEILWVEEPNAG